jgi:hypothetical protein
VDAWTCDLLEEPFEAQEGLRAMSASGLGEDSGLATGRRGRCAMELAFSWTSDQLLTPGSLAHLRLVEVSFTPGFQEIEERIVRIVRPTISEPDRRDADDVL